MINSSSSTPIKLFRRAYFMNISNLVIFFIIISVNLKLAQAAVDATSEADSKRPPVSRLLVMTLATDVSREEFKRFNRSIEAYDLELTVLKANDGQTDETATTINQEPSGKQRIEIFKKALSTYKGEQDLVIMMVDGYNLIFNGNKKDILYRFDKFNSKTKIVFSAESECWPDASLISKYPVASGERYLNSGAFIGYAPALWELLSFETNINSLLTGDTAIASAAAAAKLTRGQSSNSFEQLYFTQAYLNLELRQKLGIELDHKAELFQNLHSVESDVELEFNSDGVRLKNLAHSTEPVVVHGMGASKVVLNSLGNYLGKAWTLSNGCRYCNESSISLSSTKESELPTVFLGLFIEEPTPFLDDFFSATYKLNYPRDKIHLFIHSSIKFHDKQVDKFLNNFGSQYASQQVIKSYEDLPATMPEWLARNYALERCKQLANCDYLFSLDSVVRLEFVDTLRVLIETNKTIVAPLLSRPKKLWSNFWGSITADGYYARSHDYVDLVTRLRIGQWNVPHIMNAYLIDGKFIKKYLNDDNNNNNEVIIRERISTKSQVNLTYYDPILKPVLAFTHNLREANVFQYMLNTYEFGHLVDPTHYDISVTHPDFYQLKDNMDDWEQHYLHENYTKLFDDGPDGKMAPLEQPCQDVFWFPLVNDVFCQQLIDIMETFGQWSGGTNDDPRIDGGYESVPTRDIHMKQVGLQEMWLTFLHEYVMPIQLKEYIGYEHDPPRAELAFVVRYHPAEQPSLRPHHDSSTYTLNIALNTPNLDYEGGGCKFIRYNCSVVESRKGWALIHPGRLTHYHEGLPVTKGTRYIMVTFVDP